MNSQTPLLLFGVVVLFVLGQIYIIRNHPKRFFETPLWLQLAYFGDAALALYVIHLEGYPLILILSLSQSGLYYLVIGCVGVLVVWEGESLFWSLGHSMRFVTGNFDWSWFSNLIGPSKEEILHRALIILLPALTGGER